MNSLSDLECTEDEHSSPGRKPVERNMGDIPRYGRHDSVKYNVVILRNGGSTVDRWASFVDICTLGVTYFDRPMAKTQLHITTHCVRGVDL